MADNKTVIEVEVKGTDAATNSLKNLKKELREAQAAALNGDGKAAKRVAELKDKLDDLNDSTKTLKGSGIERATASFQLLGEGVRNLDFGPIKTGLAGLRTALASTGILLIVQAVGYLISNFDELTKGSGGVAKALKAVGDVVSSVINFFTDLIGLTSESERAFKKQSESIKKFAEDTNKALASTNAEYDRQISVMKANGESTVKLEKAKQLAILETNAAIIHQLLAYKKAGGELSEEQRKQLVASTEAIKNARTAITVGEIEENKRRRENYQNHIKEKTTLDEKVQKEKDEADAKAKAEAEKAEQERIKAEEKQKADYEKYLEWEKAARLKRDQEEVAEFIEKENQLKKEQEETAKRKKEYAERDFKLTKDGLAAGQALSDAVFAIQASKLKKGSAESEALAKKQFQVNKAFNLATATADGYKAVISTFAATPGGVVIKSIAAGIAGVFAAAQIAKIASSKFEGGGSAPTTETPNTSAMNTAEPPTITQPIAQTATTPGTNFDAQGNVIGGGAMKAYVVETEITNKQTTVNRLQSQAEFG
jgi:hypothetical protein